MNKGYYDKYIKYKTKYYLLKKGGAAAESIERQNLIDTFRKYQSYFNQYLEYVKNNDSNKNSYLLEGEEWGNDPKRFTTEFLKKAMTPVHLGIESDNYAKAVANDSDERKILIDTFRKYQSYFVDYLEYVNNNDPNKNSYLVEGEKWGNDPKRFTTEFLKKAMTPVHLGIQAHNYDKAVKKDSENSKN